MTEKYGTPFEQEVYSTNQSVLSAKWDGQHSLEIVDTICVNSPTSGDQTIFHVTSTEACTALHSFVSPSVTTGVRSMPKAERLCTWQRSRGHILSSAPIKTNLSILVVF